MTLPEEPAAGLAPLVRGRKGEHSRLLEEMRRRGFVRVRVNGQIYELEEPISLDKNKKHSIEVMVDRLVVREGIETRLADSLETTLKLGEGLALVQEVEGEEHLFSERFSCPHCGFSFEEISPRLSLLIAPTAPAPSAAGWGGRRNFLRS